MSTRFWIAAALLGWCLSLPALSADKPAFKPGLGIALMDAQVNLEPGETREVSVRLKVAHTGQLQLSLRPDAALTLSGNRQRVLNVVDSSPVVLTLTLTARQAGRHYVYINAHQPGQPGLNSRALALRVQAGKAPEKAAQRKGDTGSNYTRLKADETIH